MVGAEKIFWILLLVKDLEVFICDFLGGLWGALPDFVVRRNRLLLGVKQFGYE